MKKFIARFATVLMLSTLGAGALGVPAASADVTCSGTISNRTIKDNIQVRSGGTCTIINSRVEGNVRTHQNARLMIDRSTITGNVEGFDNWSLVVRNSVVDGNVINDRGGQALILNNTVDGNIEAFSTKGPQRIFRNTVDGNIVCKNNRSILTGALNRVNGSYDEQCRNLRQVPVLKAENRTRYAAADGHVYVWGNLSIYDTYGNFRTFPNQRVTIQSRGSDGVWRTVRTSSVTSASTGYWIAAVPRQRGYDLRAVYVSPTNQIHNAYLGLGKMG